MIEVKDLSESVQKRVKTYRRDSKHRSQTETLGDIITTISDGLFQPTRHMRIVKAGFLDAYQKMSRDERDRNPLGEVAPDWVDSLMGTGSLVQDWAAKDQRFMGWFVNKRDFNDRIEALAEMALEKADAILTSDDPMLAGAQTQLIKSLLAMHPSQKESAKPKVDIGSLLGGLSVDQLQLLVSSQAGKIGVAFKSEPKQLEAYDE